MALKEEFEKSGNWLFQRRSTLPLLILPLLILALKNSEHTQKTFSGSAEVLWQSFSIFLSCLGFFVRCFTVGWVTEGTSGRNTKGQLAEKLNTDGMYSIVRHPLYLGNFLILFGVALFIQVFWFAGIFALCFWLYYERIMFAEEEFLRRKFQEAYSSWDQKTPAFIPNFKEWRCPKKAFSIRMVLRREYGTLLGLVVSFILLEFLDEFFSKNQLRFLSFWWILLGFAFGSYFFLRHLRKKTKWLS